MEDLQFLATLTNTVIIEVSTLWLHGAPRVDDPHHLAG
jgi:hypothetical protein